MNSMMVMRWGEVNEGWRWYRCQWIIAHYVIAKVEIRKFVTKIVKVDKKEREIRRTKWTALGVERVMTRDFKDCSKVLLEMKHIATVAGSRWSLCWNRCLWEFRCHLQRYSSWTTHYCCRSIHWRTTQWVCEVVARHFVTPDEVFGFPREVFEWCRWARPFRWIVFGLWKEFD